MARVLFSAEDPTELRRRAWYLRHLIAAEAARMAEIQTLVASRDEARARLTADLLEISNLRAELRVQEAELRVKRAERDAMLARARATPELEAEVAAALDTEGQALASQLSAAAAPDERIAATRAFRANYGKLPWPVDVAALPSSRGANRRGLDIPAPFGAPVRAVAEGRVVSAGYVKGYGETVHVEHGDYATIYGHMTGLNVRAGSAVRVGQVLGLVGDSGLGDVSLPTLSFELRYNGSPQDPLAWLHR
jgi:septal ring factor EnvC (AmiA/AmiB activator)